MATLDPNFSLQNTHISLPTASSKYGDRTYNYAALPLSVAIPDASQLQVIWRVNTV